MLVVTEIVRIACTLDAKRLPLVAMFWIAGLLMKENKHVCPTYDVKLPILGHGVKLLS